MAKQSRSQRATVGRVMHEYKHGELKAARGRRKVKSRKQAIAIALHEAGASKFESKQKNEKNLQRTKRKERKGETGQAAREGKGRAHRTLARAGQRSGRTSRTRRRASSRSRKKRG
jgi:hypothetical protein